MDLIKSSKTPTAGKMLHENPSQTNKPIRGYPKLSRLFVHRIVSAFSRQQQRTDWKY